MYRTRLLVFLLSSQSGIVLDGLSFIRLGHENRSDFILLGLTQVKSLCHRLEFCCRLRDAVIRGRIGKSHGRKNGEKDKCNFHKG